MTYPAYQDDQRKITNYLKARGEGDRWPCGHKRTPANTTRRGTNVSGEPNIGCRECRRKNQRDAYHRSHGGMTKAQPVPTREPLDLSGDEAVKRYRAEKARRGDQLAPVLAEAKAAFLQLCEDAAPHRKGRPVGSKSNAWQEIAPRDRDLHPRS